MSYTKETDNKSVFKRILKALSAMPSDTCAKPDAKTAAPNKKVKIIFFIKQPQKKYINSLIKNKYQSGQI